MKRLILAAVLGLGALTGLGAATQAHAESYIYRCTWQGYTFSVSYPWELPPATLAYVNSFGFHCVPAGELP